MRGASAGRTLRTATVAALLGVVTSPVALLAAEDSHGDEHAPETFLGIPKWIWMSANLALFFYLLFRFIGPGLNAFFTARAQQIRADLDRAAQQDRDSGEMQRKLEAEVRELEAEMESVVTRAREDGERERTAILEQAQSERARLLQQAEKAIELRLSQAQGQLKDYTAALAADLARETIEASLTADDRDRLFDENLGRLERGAQ